MKTEDVDKGQNENLGALVTIAILYYLFDYLINSCFFHWTAFQIRALFNFAHSCISNAEQNASNSICTCADEWINDGEAKKQKLIEQAG